MCAYKVIDRKEAVILNESGFIPNQLADVNCRFIHSCDFDTIEDIQKRFFKNTPVAVFKINLEIVAREGFAIKYESNKPGGVKYWHFYRPENEPHKLLSINCIEFEQLMDKLS
jgi:hypothetical protein